MAARASIDISTLSRLESGVRRIALDHLPALASALGVSTDDLLRPQARQDPRVRGRARTHDGLTMWPLTDHGPAGGLQAFKMRISPDRRVPPTKLPVHEGHDWMYVLTGDTRLVVPESCGLTVTHPDPRPGRLPSDTFLQFARVSSSDRGRRVSL